MNTRPSKEQLIQRVKKIRGQVNAVETALEEEKSSISTLQTLAACRGAIIGLMGELIEDHIRSKVVTSVERLTPDQIRSVDELSAIVRSYLK